MGLFSRKSLQPAANVPPITPNPPLTADYPKTADPTIIAPSPGYVTGVEQIAGAAQPPTTNNTAPALPGTAGSTAWNYSNTTDTTAPLPPQPTTPTEKAPTAPIVNGGDPTAGNLLSNSPGNNLNPISTPSATGETNDQNPLSHLENNPVG